MKVLQMILKIYWLQKSTTICAKTCQYIKVHFQSLLPCETTMNFFNCFSVVTNYLKMI